MSRVVCLFSCGAASAVAAKLAASDANGRPVVYLYTEVEEEHPDNKRFLSDCEKWFGAAVQVVRNEKYEGSIYQVFERNRFIKGPGGAACTKRLKRDIRDQYLLSDDLVVLGFTAEEQDRLDRFIDSNAHVKVSAPLIERGLTKADCLAMVERAGIELPMMYRLGYKNNNCRGCVKGGKGYWNKVRNDFPVFFHRMAALQEKLGEGSYFFAGEDGRRISLNALPKDAGDYPSEPDISCGIFCEMAEKELA